MANVCRPLQNGLPALRFAVIRRAFGAFAFGIGLEPARVGFACLVLARLVTGPEDVCSRLLGLFLFQPLHLPCASDRDADVQLGRSHALARLRSIARLLKTGSAAGASCAA